MRAIFVIPSEVEGSRCETFKVDSRDVSASLDMTEGGYLFHRVCRHDLNAVNRDALRGFATRPIRSRHRWGVADLIEHIQAFDQFAKRRVLVIEPTNRLKTNEELTACRVRLGFACHGNDTAFVRMIVKLGFDPVTSRALPVTAFLRRVFGVGIAALNHEPLHDAMKNRAVVKTGSRQFLEVRDRFRRSVSPKLHHHSPPTCFDYRHFSARGFLLVCRKGNATHEQSHKNRKFHTHQWHEAKPPQREIHSATDEARFRGPSAHFADSKKKKMCAHGPHRTR